MEPEKSDNTIIAAGGLITDPPPGEKGEPVRVLLVHRPKYDDWVFPKGKADPGETIEQTALREVREETGLDCAIISRFTESRYSYADRKGRVRPKVVHFFLMRPVGGELSVDGSEIDRVEWVELDSARSRLNYVADQHVLDELKSTLNKLSQNPAT
jgi:8-oxo-dGTP pyrophosphatase MutT (NUDIX family)